MNDLNFCVFPLKLNTLDINSMFELQILALAGSLPDGLRKSNVALADLFCTSRKTVVQALARLREKGLLANTGNTRQRVLTVQGKARELFNEYFQSQPDHKTLDSRSASHVTGVKTTPAGDADSSPAAGVKRHPAAGAETTPHNIINQRENNECKRTHIISNFPEKKKTVAELCTEPSSERLVSDLCKKLADNRLKADSEIRTQTRQEMQAMFHLVESRQKELAQNTRHSSALSKTGGVR